MCRKENLFEKQLQDILHEFSAHGFTKDRLVLETDKGDTDTIQIFDALRVCVKYLLFDLECLKREQQFLKKLLEEKDRD